MDPLVELCNFKSNMYELSCQSKKAGLVIAIGTGALMNFVAMGLLFHDTPFIKGR